MSRSSRQTTQHASESVTGTAAPHDRPMSQSEFTVDLEPGQKPPKGFVRGRTVALACLALVVGIGVLNLYSNLEGNERDRRRTNDALVSNSVAVDQTFTEITNGVVQTFTAKSPADVEAIQRYTEELLLIRRNVPDYGVVGIKDHDGREVLETNPQDLTVTRAETAGGASLTYSSKNPELVAELRKWAAEIAAYLSRRGP